MDHENPEVPEEDRLDEPQPQVAGDGTLLEPEVSDDAEAAAAHQHDDERVDEWEEESFPASDPPSNY
ncbi:hypothetical protein LG293_07720 [Citricoccus nitrophenolicus]